MDRHKQTQTVRDRLGQTRTNRDRQGQTGTRRDRHGQTLTRKDKLAGEKTRTGTKQGRSEIIRKQAGIKQGQASTNITGIKQTTEGTN